MGRIPQGEDRQNTVREGGDDRHTAFWGSSEVDCKIIYFRYINVAPSQWAHHITYIFSCALSQWAHHSSYILNCASSQWAHRITYMYNCAPSQWAHHTNYILHYAPSQWAHYISYRDKI
jgi:hypothetical protein